MSQRASIVVACPSPSERASVAEWLGQSGYDPLPIPDLSQLDRDLHARPIEAVIADMALVPGDSDVSGLMRRLGGNRPLVMLGEVSRVPAARRSEVTVIARPVERDALLLSVGLALAEGRPARRFARRSVEPIAASAHGIAVTVREASVGGVGIELAGPRSGTLPPFFSLRIPEFGVHVLVKRAWLAPIAPQRMRCGGTVEGDLPDAVRPWSEFALEAPGPVANLTHWW